MKEKGAWPRQFRELGVWQKAVDLSVLIYRLTGALPKNEEYGLTSQMRRAAVSIASNVAEGCGRGTDKSFRAFVGVAIGSAFELQTQLFIVRRLELGNVVDLQAAEVLSQEVVRMLYGLKATLGRDVASASIRAVVEGVGV